MEADVLIESDARKKGFKPQPKAINSESEDGHLIGRRSRMAGNPSLLLHFCLVSLPRFHPHAVGLSHSAVRLAVMDVVPTC